MHIVVIYDIREDSEEKRNDIIAGLDVLGYRKGWVNTASNSIYYLPKNALFKLNISQQDAFNEVQNFMTSRRYILVRCIVLPSAPWVGMYGENY